MDQPCIRSLLTKLIDTFYDRVRLDPDIGPLFNAAVHDWDEHKATLLEFWSSIILKTGSYRGNPMGLHRRHAITADHFAVWIGLWRIACTEILPDALARLMIRHAERIGESLKYGLGISPRRLRTVDL